MGHMMLVYSERLKSSCTRVAKVLTDQGFNPDVAHASYKDWWGVWVPTAEYSRAHEIVWGTDAEVA